MNRILNVTAVVLTLLCVPLPAQAVNPEIEGVRFERVYTDGNVTLPLQGTGLFRYLGLFKAYVGAIYYEADMDARQLLDNRPKRLEVEYLHPINAEDFGRATNTLIRKNVDQATLAQIQAQIARHNDLYRDVQRGDRYALTYIPGRGTELTLNGEALGVIEGETFATALFAMWLGEKPMSRAFKEQLLGLAGEPR